MLRLLLCIHLCTAKKGSSIDKFLRRQQQHRSRRMPAPTRAPTPVGPTQVPTTAAPAAAPDRRGAVRARGGMLAQRVTTTPDRRQAVRLRAGVLAKRAAAAPLPVLSATKCVVALLVVSETDLMAVVDRRLQQTAAVRDGRAAVIFVADRHDHALNKGRLDTTRLRYVENADMAAVAGTDVSEYATEASSCVEINRQVGGRYTPPETFLCDDAAVLTESSGERPVLAQTSRRWRGGHDSARRRAIFYLICAQAPRLRSIADCGDIRIRSQRCAQMMPRKYWRDLVTAAFWVALRSAPRAEYVLRVEPDAMLCLDSLVTALAAVPASAKPFVLGLRRYCHYDDTFSLVSRPLADAVVFEWPHLRDFARLTTKYTMYGMVWPALVHWLRRVRGFEAELLASNPDLKTLIESEQVAVHKSNSAALRCTPSTRHLSDRATLRRLSGTPDSLVDLCRKLERYVQIVDPIDHRSGRAKTSALAYKVTYEREAQAGFAKQGVRRDEETREWILYYTDRFGRNITRKNLRGHFARLEALRAAQPRTAPAERCLARWSVHKPTSESDARERGRAGSVER